MSPQSRKVAAFALGSSLEMFVLILVTFLTAAVGDHLYCDEYCTSLKSTQIRSTGRSECNCYPQNAEEESVKGPNLDGNPIYYEPLELHPSPDISFVYQPFVISNPTSSSDNKPSQETEHHRKYKRKDNIIHKISIDTPISPLYLDIDIKNSQDGSRSSQNYMNVFDDLQLTEQDLKDCIDLHLLFHFRRNGTDELKLNSNVQNLEKYFHLSDDDLLMELNKRCKQPSDKVDQSLRQIKEMIGVIKPQFYNYSETDNISDNKHKWNTRLNESLIPISTEMPGITPEKYLFHNKNEDNINRSNANTFNKQYINNTPQPDVVKKEIKNLTEESSSVISLPLESDKLVNAENNNETKFAGNKANTANKSLQHINGTRLIDDISYRAVFNKPKLEQGPLLSLLTTVDPGKKTVIPSTAESLKFSTLDNIDENNRNKDGDISMHGEDFLRTASAPTIIVPQSTKENYYSVKSTYIVNDNFSPTTQHYLDDTAFVTRGSYLNNDLNIENMSIINDLEQSSSNMEHIKYTDNLPEITTKNILNKSKDKPRSDENLVVTTDSYMYKYDPFPLITKANNKNDLTEKEMTAIFDPPYNDNDVSSLTPTTEIIVLNNNTANVNRTIIPENKLQIPRILVTEYSNETVDSTIDGIEEMPNNDYIGIRNFEMDVADLTSSNEISAKDNTNSIGNGEHNETHDNIKPSIGKHYNGKEAGESSDTSEISGNLYFMFKKLLIPMRFIQSTDGELKLILDGTSFCNNLLSGANDNGILAILCNSAIHNKNKFTKI